MAALGGLLPTVVGIGGISGCFAVLRASQWTASTRLAACIGVTVLAWRCAFGVLALFHR